MKRAFDLFTVELQISRTLHSLEYLDGVEFRSRELRV